MIELNPLIKRLINENWSKNRFLFEVFKFHIGKYPNEDEAMDRLKISRASFYRVQSQIDTEKKSKNSS